MSEREKGDETKEETKDYTETTSTNFTNSNEQIKFINSLSQQKLKDKKKRGGSKKRKLVKGLKSKDNNQIKSINECENESNEDEHEPKVNLIEL